MVHQLRSGTKWHIGTQSVLERPELAKHIGSICGACTVLEYKVAELYSLILGSRIKSSAGNPIIDELGFHIFSALPALKQRLDLLEKAIHLVLEPFPAEIEKFKLLKKQIRRATEHRNDVVHGLWAFSPDYPDALILRDHSKRKHVYVDSDFKQTFVEIENAVIAVSEFHVNLSKLFKRK
jgi:hypothetical protein